MPSNQEAVDKTMVLVTGLDARIQDYHTKIHECKEEKARLLLALRDGPLNGEKKISYGGHEYWIKTKGESCFLSEVADFSARSALAREANGKAKSKTPVPRQTSEEAPPVKKLFTGFGPKPSPQEDATPSTKLKFSFGPK